MIQEGKYFMVESWEIYGGAGKYNFFLQVYDERYNEVKDHPANDQNFGGDRWKRIGGQINKAIKKAQKYKLQRVYSINQKTNADSTTINQTNK
jgi:hypothetical protein